jgi:hypothetical protein
MGAKRALFNPCGTFSQERGWSYEVCNSLQPQRAALKLLSIETEETAWGQKTSHGGVRVGIFLAQTFQFHKHCCDLDAREQIHQATLVSVPVRTVFSRGMRHLVQVGSKCFLRIDQI